MIAWSPKQKNFFANSYNNINILSGSVSSGKTYISNVRWLKHIYDAPQNSLLIAVGKTSETLKDNVIRPIMEMDQGFELNETKVPMRLYCKANNVEVACGGGDNSASWARIQGKTTAGALFDEATTLPKKLVQNVCKGCRHGGQLWPVFMTCNPDHPNHYIRTDYINNTKINARTWEFRLMDNPSLSKEYVNHVQNLYSGAEYLRMIEGKWVMAEGVVYKEFDRGKHLFTDNDIKNVSIKEHVIGIDWGWTNPLAMILFAVDYDNNYWCLDEIYIKNQHIDDSLKAIMNQRGWIQKKIAYAYADTNNPENITRFRNTTGIITLPAVKDVIPGISLVQKMTKDGRMRYHHARVPNTLSEKDMYCWKETKGLTRDDPIKENDHLMDAERYVIYTRERGRVRLINKRAF